MAPSGVEERGTGALEGAEGRGVVERMLVLGVVDLFRKICGAEVSVELCQVHEASVNLVELGASAEI